MNQSSLNFYHTKKAEEGAKMQPKRVIFLLVFLLSGVAPANPTYGSESLHRLALAEAVETARTNNAMIREATARSQAAVEESPDGPPR